MLTRQEQDQIAQFTSALRAALPGYRERDAQQEMVRSVAGVFDSCRHGSDTADTDGSNFLVCESGTGTGKTFAYAVPGIVLARSVGKRLVISSSTIALQEQLIVKDLPLLLKCAPFTFSYAIGKGRSRYVCTVKLNALAEKVSQGQIRFDEGASVPEEGLDLMAAVELSRALASGEWDGDQDRLTSKLPVGLWERVTTDRNGCAGNKCPEFSACPFFQARRRMQEADVIVANHDLVLAALAMQPGTVLPDPADCFFVFDEGHALPQKVLSHYAERHPVRATYSLLTAIPDVVMTAVHSLGLNAALHVDVQKACLALGEALRDLIGWIDEEVPSDSEIHRFKGGSISDSLRVIGLEMLDRGQLVLNQLADIRAGSLKRAAERPEIAQTLLASIGEHLARTEDLVNAWRLMLKVDKPGAPPTARWIERNNGDHSVSASPINAGDRLTTALWRRCSAAVLTSATITSCGEFGSFLHQTGLNRFPETNLLRLDSPFDYWNRARIVVPKMKSDPTDHVSHTDEVITLLPGLVEPGATLVLFASARQMQEVYSRTTDELRTLVLMQGALPKSELLRRHKEMILDGKTSVLFGLASLAEGVDLPGHYLTHVIIAKLPFPVPDHPLEEARREWIESKGGSAFHEATLPDAAIKLAQMVGRLMRTEDDTGKITILDRRIATKSYGKLLLRGLPPMRVEIFGRVTKTPLSPAGAG
ncbi:MAG: hypothetical protein B7X93_12565 [Hydrogenophilales bacterium 17-61-9]|nr:MAG: hypothetical protein B7X93_12565 [Hydrogenophilales bacterium 17-61-9]